MEHSSTIFIVNGSSLGGGEVDSIIRAALCAGSVLSLVSTCEEVLELAKGYRVPVIGWREAVRLIAQGRCTVVLSSFLRDLILAVPLACFKLLRRSRLIVSVGIHSDPLSGLRPIGKVARLALWAYKVFVILMADQVRFVSERQLTTFEAIASRKRFCIDPPTSLVSRSLRSQPVKKSRQGQRYDFLFVGRLSSSSLLGDAKNSDFILEFSDLIERKGGSLHVVGAGNRADIIERLSRNARTLISSPTPQIEEILAQATTVLVPSIHEGYCLLAREAALAGCRVLVSSAIAPEVQSHDRVTVMSTFDVNEWYEEAHRGT